MRSIEQKVIAGFIAAFIVLLVLCGLTWNFSHRALDSAKFVAHTHEVIGKIGDIKVQLYRAVAGQRGYLISGKPLYLEDYHSAIEELKGAIGQLNALTIDSPQQQIRVQALTQEVQRRVETFDSTIKLRDQAGLTAVQENYGVGQTALLAVRAAALAIENDERRLLQAREAETEHGANIAQASFAGLLMLVALGFPLLYRRVSSDLQARARAQAKTAQLLAILDNTPDFIAMSDSRGAVSYLNRAMREHLGIGEQAVDLIDRRSFYPEWVNKIIQETGNPAARLNGSWSGETALIAADASQTPISQVVIAHPQADGKFAYSMVARSIADSKKAERLMQQAGKYDLSTALILALYNAETDRRKVLQGTLDMLADQHPFPVSAFYSYESWGGALRLIAARCAPRGTQELIKPGEGLVGEAARTLRLIHIEQPDAGLLPIEAGFGGLAPAALLYCPVIYREHLLGVLVLASIEPVSERDCSFIEQVAAQLGVALHNLKQLEDMQLLAEQLRERSEEITQKNLQVEEASRMKSEFLANMSHELRTPLNAIIGFSEVIREGLAGEINLAQREYINDIYTSGQHLLSLINDILDLSKIESGQMRLELDTADGAALIASGVAVLREKAMTGRITLTQQVAPDMVNLQLDVRKTKQIIYNLLSNAIKFTPEGGRVEISLQPVSRQEILSCKALPGSRIFPLADSACEQFIEIRVVDSGIGIDADSLEHLFKPFTQIESSHSRSFEGTGLGLVMIARLAELHGGGMMVKSAPGQGTGFSVWLPRLGQPAAAPLAGPTVRTLGEDAPAGIPGSKALAASTQAPLVLVIEDEPHAAKLLRLQLGEEGYRVEHAGSAETGMRLAFEKLPDAIVLDILLPGIDGWAMLAQLKAEPRTAGIPVVIVSITDDPARGFALGATQVLTKPVKPDDLSAALQMLDLQPSSGAPILVADDDPKAVSLVSTHLKAAGYEPIGAYSGGEAIELARSKKPRAVVLDLVMPEVTGFDVIKALLERAETADIPIIIVSSKTLSQQERIWLEGKVQRVIDKAGINPAVLHKEVRRALALPRRIADEKAPDAGRA